MEKTLEWFKKEVSPDLLNYKITYRSYKNGDFGDLDQVIIESKSWEVGLIFGVQAGLESICMIMKKKSY